MHKHGGDIYSYENIIDFSANINPLDAPESVKEAIIKSAQVCGHYPDVQCRELKKALNEKTGINTDFVTFGNGAAELIFALAFALKPQKAIVTAPTFEEYAQALDAVGCKTERYSLNEKNGFKAQKDFIDYIDQYTDIVFLCNPNNPTGIVYNKEFTENVLKKCIETDTYLVIDECFNNFLENGEEVSLINKIEKYKKLVILKAFTKMYAMAGIRLGYIICSCKEFHKKIKACIQPWSVSVTAQMAGCAALREKNWEEKTREYVKKEKKFLLENMEKLGVKIFGSEANYIFFKEEKDFDKKMFEKGFLIRNCENYIGLSEGFFRIAVRKHEENKSLIKAWNEIKR